MRLNPLIYLLLISSLLACKKSKTTSYHENGNKYEEYETNEEDEKNGLYISYYESGKMREKAFYTNNEYNGMRTLYYENGNVEIEEPYDTNGKLNGIYKSYYENGQLYIEKPYINNAINGVLKGYYPSGQLKEEVNIIDNNENGPFTEYHENGQIQWKGTYLNGDNEYGLLEEYDTTGQMIKRMKCDSMGICRTFWRPKMPMINYDTLTIEGLNYLNSQITIK